MAEGKTRWSLDDVMSAAEKGIVYSNYYNDWQGFKEEWSQEDRAIWDSLLKRVNKGADGKLSLIPPLTSKEMAWVMGVYRRAEERGLC